MSRQYDEMTNAASSHAENANRFTLEIYPDRSPLHREALTIKDLKLGLTLVRIHVWEGHPAESGTGTIMSEPFRRGRKYGEDDPQAHSWMVSVKTTDHDGVPIEKDWYLTDMGIAPYMQPDGVHGWWNSQNYTLAAS